MTGTNVFTTNEHPALVAISEEQAGEHQGPVSAWTPGPATSDTTQRQTRTVSMCRLSATG